MPKQPRAVFPGIAVPCPITFAFPPNRETLGATAYLIVENTGNILLDCPAWNPSNQEFLQSQGGVRSLMLTHRGAIAQVAAIQEALNCEVIIQEQEAYLLPGVTVTPFQHRLELQAGLSLIWTSGHTPGSACLYHPSGILFTGRHLLPTPQGQLAPIRTAKTFHWPRQIQSVRSLIQAFNPETLHGICPGGEPGVSAGGSPMLIRRTNDYGP